MRRNRQAVSVIVSLVGLQDTTVVAHRPGTDGAAVSVRVGGALVYMHDAETVSSFARTWKSMARPASVLPREADATRATPVRGMLEPAVMVEAANSPPVSARLERPAGRASWMRIMLGRVMFEVRDVGAFHSTVAAFRRAEELAASAFLPTPARTAREQAARTAARAFAVPAGAPRSAPAAARPARSAVQPGVRPSRTSIERAV